LGVNDTIFRYTHHTFNINGKGVVQ
jgi:hypothetical protein